MRPATPSGLPFMKMHGLGNDFVVIDLRESGGAAADVSDALTRAAGERRWGVGFDQLVLITDGDTTLAPGAGGDTPIPDGGAADLTLAFRNADGSTAGACGNATRCVAAWEMGRRGTDRLRLRTQRGVLAARRTDGGVAVNMGAPLTAWRDIPLAHQVDTDALPLDGAPVATGMGNPHCTFFVDDAEAEDLETIGPRIETAPLFPERTNVQIAQVLAPDRLRVRIWERGVGVTPASGSSACAAAVAAHRRGLTKRRVTVVLDGGALDIDWRDDGVWMAGPTAHVFDGILTPAFLEALG